MESIKNAPASDDEFIDAIPKIETVIFEDNTKCGEVLIGPTAEFTFVCALCKNQYKDMYEFGNHIRVIHFQAVAGDADEPCAKSYGVQVADPLFEILDEKLKPNRVETSRRKQKPEKISISLEEESASSKDVSESHFEEIFEDSDCSTDKSEEVENRLQTIRQRDKLRYPFWCKICDRGYVRSPQFEAHIKNMHIKKSDSESSTDEKIKDLIELICKYCDKPFSSIKVFNEHGDIHLGTKKYTCSYCPKKFPCLSSRQSHTNSHTGERPFQCPHCPKAFSNSSNLHSHINIHLNIRRYSCDFCAKTFVKSTEKIMHERTHTGEKPFQCEECGQRFLARTKLTEHKRRHLNIRNYVCEVCNKAFYSMNLLKDHMPKHTKERPFVCNICEQTFPRRKALRTHAQLHSAVKQYVCDTCGKSFAQSAGLYSHRKSHGGIAFNKK